MSVRKVAVEGPNLHRTARWNERNTTHTTAPSTPRTGRGRRNRSVTTTDIIQYCVLHGYTTRHYSSGFMPFTT